MDHDDLAGICQRLEFPLPFQNFQVATQQAELAVSRAGSACLKSKIDGGCVPVVVNTVMLVHYLQTGFHKLAQLESAHIDELVFTVADNIPYLVHLAMKHGGHARCTTRLFAMYGLRENFAALQTGHVSVQLCRDGQGSLCTAQQGQNQPCQYAGR